MGLRRFCRFLMRAGSCFIMWIYMLMGFIKGALYSGTISQTSQNKFPTRPPTINPS